MVQKTVARHHSVRVRPSPYDDGWPAGRVDAGTQGTAGRQLVLGGLGVLVLGLTAWLVLTHLTSPLMTPTGVRPSDPSGEVEPPPIAEPRSQASGTPVLEPEPTVAVAPEPAPNVSPVTTARPTSYVLRPGDTLSAIAQRFGLSVQYLAALNGLVNPNHVVDGQTLLLQPRDAPVGPTVTAPDTAGPG